MVQNSMKSIFLFTIPFVKNLKNKWKNNTILGNHKIFNEIWQKLWIDRNFSTARVFVENLFLRKCEEFIQK